MQDQVGICKDEEFKRKENDIQTKILQDSEFITSFADLQKEIKEMLVGNLQENSISKKQALDVEKVVSLIEFTIFFFIS